MRVGDVDRTAALTSQLLRLLGLKPDRNARADYSELVGR